MHLTLLIFKIKYQGCLLSSQVKVNLSFYLEMYNQRKIKIQEPKRRIFQVYKIKVDIKVDLR